MAGVTSRGYLFLLATLLAACSNPLGSSTYNSTYHPGVNAEASQTTSTVSASLTTLFADGQTSTLVTVTLLDSHSKPSAGKSVSLSSNRGAVDVITPSTTTTSSNGTAFFTVTSTEVGSTILTAVDVTDLITVNQTLPLTFSNAVVFVGTDTGTQGSWMGVYGLDGYWISQSISSLPSYAPIGISGNMNYVWTNPTIDVRGLQVPASSRIAACWYNTTPVVYDINLTDNLQHRVAFYILDWDMAGRSETMTIRDFTTMSILNTQVSGSFTGGTWFVWKITGHVQLTVTLNSGVNAVVSGIFFN